MISDNHGVVISAAYAEMMRHYGLKGIHILKCIGDMNSSKRCKTYRDIKAVYKCDNNMDCNIGHDLRMFYTKFRLSNHNISYCTRAVAENCNTISCKDMYTL